MKEKRIIELFHSWDQLKIKIHLSKKAKYFKQGEVWWCNMGQNVGAEINGKNKYFARPVLIYKKLSKDSFLAVPISKQIKTGSWYVNIKVGGEARTAVVSQIKILSSFRLVSKQDKLEKEWYEAIRSRLKSLYIDSAGIQ